MSKKDMKEKKKGFNLYSLFKKSKGFDRTIGDVPPIVTEPILWLKERNALGEEGIFRIPGSATEIKNLKARYDKGKKVDLSVVENVHSVAGLLKVFFRELPEPLMTFELYESWLASIRPEDTRTKIVYIKRVLENLPAGNKVILETLISFLREVAEYKTNCMGIRNLSIVFAPNIIRPRVENIEEILANSSSVNTLMMLLIQYYRNIFLNKEFEEQEEAEEAVLSPHLISLKKAQSLLHSNLSTSESEEHCLSSSVPDQRNHSKSVLNRNTKHTFSSSLDEDSVAKIRRKESRRNVPQSVTSKQKAKKRANDDDSLFIDTLKKATLKLASSLIEEKELEIEAAELNQMPEEERDEVERKIKKKITETKQLKKKARKARKIRRIQSANNVQSKKITGKKTRKTSLSRHNTSIEDKPSKLKPFASDLKIEKKRRHDRDLSTSSLESDVTKSSVTSSEDVYCLDDLKFEDELDEILESEENMDIDEDIKTAGSSQSDSDFAPQLSPIKENKELEDSLENLIESVTSGDMNNLNKFLNEMPKMNRMERTKSKKSIVSRIKKKQRTQSMV